MSDIRNRIYVSTSVLNEAKSVEAILDETAARSLLNVELGVRARFSTGYETLLRQSAAEGRRILFHNYVPPPAEPFVLNLASADGDVQDRSRQLVQRAVELSASVGAPLYTLHAGFRVQASPEDLGGDLTRCERIPLDEAISNFVHAARFLADYAADLGVKLGIENNVLEPYNLVDGRNELLLGVTAQDLLDLLDRIDHPNAGLLIDVGHLKVSAQTLGFDAREFLTDVSGRVLALHLHDNGGVEDSHEAVTRDSWFWQPLERALGHDVIWILETSRQPWKAVEAQVELVARTARRTLPVMEPGFKGNEAAYLQECITTGWVSSQGSFVSNFEALFAQLHGVDHAIAVSSGTAALHLALEALGIGPGDEVIVPDLTFAATANAVCHAGATPVLADVSLEHWTLDPDAVLAAVGPRTRAIVAVHLYGHPCDISSLIEVARRHNLYVVEDCAQALGANYDAKPVGTLGDVGCFSFFANKVVTTGEGGMVITRSDVTAERVRLLRSHGMKPDRKYWHDVVGYNYRMTNLQAAVGLAQLERFDEILEQRRTLAENYRAELAGIPCMQMQPALPWAEPVCWLYSVLLEDDRPAWSPSVISQRLAETGVEARRIFHPLHRMPPFGNGQDDGAFPVSNRLRQTGLSLPSGHQLTGDDIRYVCDRIRDIARHALQAPLRFRSTL